MAKESKVERYQRLQYCMSCNGNLDRPGHMICTDCRDERLARVEREAGYTQDEPGGNSQEVRIREHDRTITERRHTFTCLACEKTFTIWQYPAPSRRICDDCKAGDYAKAMKREYMRQYMATKRAEANSWDEPKKRGRPRKN